MCKVMIGDATAKLAGGLVSLDEIMTDLLRDTDARGKGRIVIDPLHQIVLRTGRAGHAGRCSMIRRLPRPPRHATWATFYPD